MASIVRQLQMKLALEKRFRPEVKRINALMLQDFRSSMLSSLRPINAQRYLPAWTAAIDAHFRRTQRMFTGVTEQDIKSFSFKQMTEEEENERDRALIAWRDENAPKDAALITGTNQANMNTAVRQANEQFRSEGIIPSDREIALASTVILKKKLASRVETIVMSETQTAAESTKFIEAEVLSGITPRILGGGFVVTTARKTWRTVGDSKVRGIHRAVEGQTRRLTEPFNVNGELLMFPGDRSLGASAFNTANCRCASQFRS